MAALEPVFFSDDESVAPVVIPEPPAVLEESGIALWRSIWSEYDLGACPEKVEILTTACRYADWIALLDKAARDKPIRAKGSAGQAVISPEIQEARQYRTAQIQALRAMRLDAIEDDEDGDGPMSRHAVAKLGAQARWKYRTVQPRG